MANKDPKVLCVPINSNNLSSNARSALNNARQIASALTNAKRKQLSKARGQLARVGAPPKAAVAGLKFRQDNNIIGLTSPFKSLDFSVIDQGFKATKASEKVDYTFVEEVSGTFIGAAVMYIEVENVNNTAQLKVTYTANDRTALSSAALDAFSNALKNAKISQTPEQSREGVWLIYAVFPVGEELPLKEKFMSIRVGERKSFYNEIKKEGSLDIRKLVLPLPISVRFSSLKESLVPSERNNHRYFDLENTYGLSIDQSLLNEAVSPFISQTPVTFKSVPERPYGPEFNAIRPPGMPKNSKYAMKASVPARAIINHYQKLLKDSHAIIKNNIDPDQLTLFNHNFPNPHFLTLPPGVFSSRTVQMWSNVAAVSNAVYDVDALSYDTRVDNSGAPAGAVADEGPFGAERGLLRDSSVFIDSPTRPPKRAYDNRIGSLVISLEDEELQNVIHLPELAGTPFGDPARFNQIEEVSPSLAKLEAVCQLRLVAAARGYYNVFVDYLTVAAMFHYELGVRMFIEYSSDPADMWDVATSDFVNQWTPSDSYVKTWTALSLRVVMGSRYRDVPVYEHLRIGQAPVIPENIHRVVPFRPPNDTTKLVAWGDLVTPIGFSVKNYGDATVPSFTLGENCSLRKGRIRQIVLHWGGTRNGYNFTDGGAINAMLSQRGSNPVSTTFTITHDGLEVRQHIDLAIASWHAQEHNDIGIGIDLPSVGFLQPSFKKATEDGYVALGYTVIEAPVVRHKLLIAPQAQYELAYKLIQILRGLPQVDDSEWHNPKVLVNDNMYIVHSAHYYIDYQGGVCGHIHVSAPNRRKVDGIDSCLYWLLRSKFGDTEADAYRRMKLTLQGEVKQIQIEGKSVRCLEIDRSQL